jgi:glucose-6-phosphate isomerase
MDASELWKRYRQYLCRADSLDLTLDISRMHFDESFLASIEPAVRRAFADMDALESGAIANPDEKRMVGHYWLRAPQLSPTKEMGLEIAGTAESIKKFAADVHAGIIKPPSSPRFTQVLAIGIGGSALGPMFVGDAFGNAAADRMNLHFIDNTDPDGIARVLQTLKGLLGETLVIVTSKSGGTPDTRNGMIVVAGEYRAAGLDFSRHVVAVTMAGSQMDKLAATDNWLARFPMFDWVGGRTSELSAVGLLPAALQGIDIDAMLAGAAACDAATRVHDTRRNPAALMALMWYAATGGTG